MKHVYKDNFFPDRPVLLLLHGTAGNELSLLDIGESIDYRASILATRGNVVEDGMSRYFRRIAEGIFDEEDLLFRTEELNKFLDESAEKYGFNRRNIVAIRYSNGANIAASLLLLYPNSLRGAILHHPMVPIRSTSKLESLEGLPIFIGAGDNDPICPPEETNELEKIFTQRGAQVMVHWENNGHTLTESELEAAREWYNQKF